jgi:hypothetical protein
MLEQLIWPQKAARHAADHREDGMKALCVLAVALLAAMTARTACAADTIKIGVIYPLTGNAASAGSSAKDAVELGADIVNTAHPELAGLPLAATVGLPNLDGRKSSSSTSTTRAIRRLARIRPCG